MQNQKHKCNIHHYLPQFYLRLFTSSINTTQKKRLKIFWKDKVGDSGNSLIGNVCQMFKYNNLEQEEYLSKNRDDILSKSLRSVIENSYNDDDIYNIKKLISYMYTDTPDYRRRIINDAKKSVTKEHDLYNASNIDFIFDNDIKGRGNTTITAAKAMIDTIMDWQYEIIYFDNQLITSDSPVDIVNDEQIKDFSQMEIKSDVKNPNIIVEDIVTKRRQVYVDSIVNITKVTFPENTCIYTPLSPKIGIFLFSSKEAEDKLKQEMERLSVDNYPFYKMLNMRLYVHCNDYILGHKQELLNEASEYITIRGYTRKFSTKERKEQRIRKVAMIEF